MPSRVQSSTRGDSSSYSGLVTRWIWPFTWMAWSTKGPWVCSWIAWFIHNFRQVLWKRWTCEYATTVSESAGQKPWRRCSQSVWDASNRGKRLIGMAVHLFNGRDGVVRSMTPRAGKSFLWETRPAHLPLKLSCNSPTRTQQSSDLNRDAPPSPSRWDARRSCWLTALPGCYAEWREVGI